MAGWLWVFAPAGAATLGEALEREIGAGGPVAVLPGAELRAVSADGARSRTLAPGPVPWALVDPALDVVWFGSPDGAEVRVIDLRGRSATAVTIVRGVPNTASFGGVRVWVRGPDGRQLQMDRPSWPRVVVDLSAPGTLGWSGGYLDEVGDPAEAQQLAAAAAAADLRWRAEEANLSVAVRESRSWSRRFTHSQARVRAARPAP